MIMLTKLDRTRILVGFEAVKYIEETPDTLIRFLNGESLIVRETLNQDLSLVQEKRRRDHAGADDSAGHQRSEISHAPKDTGMPQ